jgi:hypothetical protein
MLDLFDSQNKFFFSSQIKKAAQIHGQLLSFLWILTGLIPVLIITSGVVVISLSATAKFPFGFGFCFVDLDRPALYRSAIQFGNGFPASRLVGHFHESETARSIGHLVHNDFGRAHFAIGNEKFPKIFVLQIEAQISNINVHKE